MFANLEVIKRTISSPFNLCGHRPEVHRFLNDIRIARNKLWVNRLEEESIIVFPVAQKIGVNWVKIIQAKMAHTS